MEELFRWTNSKPEVGGRVEDFKHHFDFMEKAQSFIESVLGRKIEVAFPKTVSLPEYEGDVDYEDLGRDVDDPEYTGTVYKFKMVTYFESRINMNIKEYKEFMSKLD